MLVVIDFEISAAVPFGGWNSLVALDYLYLAVGALCFVFTRATMRGEKMHKKDLLGRACGDKGTLGPPGAVLGDNSW